MIYIFDIDGTLADISRRLHHIQKEPKDWRSFYADCADDQPIDAVVAVARALGAFNEIVMITGRSEEIRKETVDWLTDARVPCHGLYMREEGDHREDCVVKAEHLDDLILNNGRLQIAGAFEDRQQVVDMYRAKGLRVFQVAEGKF